MPDTPIVPIPGGIAVGSQEFASSIDIEVSSYMAAANGDYRAALKLAIQAATTGITISGEGRSVDIGLGVHAYATGDPSPPSGYNNVGVPLPVNLVATLRIHGWGTGVSTIKLHNSARCAFYIDKKNDYDVFQNVIFEDFDVDNNNTVGRCQILVGNVPAVDTAMKYLSFQNIRVRRMACRNVPVDVTQNTTYKAFVWFMGYHTTAGEPTQTFSKNIVCEDLQLDDVQNGLLVHTNVGHTSNHYYDRISFARCRHRQSAVQAATLSQTSFYICGAGFGDYFEIVDCESINIGDDAIEIGAMTTGLIDRLRTTDTFLVSMLFRMSQACANPQAQEITIRDSQFKITPAPFAVVGLTGFQGTPVNFILDDATLNFGTFNFDRCVHDVDGMVWSISGRTANGNLGWRVRGQIRRITMDRCRVHYRNFDYDSAAINDATFLNPNLFPVAPLINVGVNSAATFVSRDFEVVFEGGTASGGGLLNMIGVQPEGSKGQVTVDGLRAVFISSATGSRSLARPGNSGNPERVILRRLSGLQVDVSPATQRGVQLKNGGSYGALILEDCDFTNWTNGGVPDVDYTGASAANAAATIEQCCRNRYGFTDEVVTVAANYAATQAARTILASGTITVTLPANPNSRLRYTVKNTGTGTITITPASGTIDGAASITIPIQFQSRELVTDGTNWSLV